MITNLYEIMRSTKILSMEAIREDLSHIEVEYIHKHAPPLDSLTNYEIEQMIYAKRRELVTDIHIPEELQRFINQLVTDNKFDQADADETLKQFCEKQANQYHRRCISHLEYELRNRVNPNQFKNSKEELIKKKQETPILDIVSAYTSNLGRYRKGGLIPCPLPDHNDKSASFMMYQNNNTFHCFGCHANGSQVDFIMLMEGCSLAEAIKRFLAF